MANYVNNKDFYKAIKEYHEKQKEDPNTKIPNYIGECFLQISRNLSNKSTFSGYPFKEDMISDAVFDCVRYANRFDPERYNNPFAYFTQICWNAFIRRIDKEKKHLYTIYKNIDSSEIFGLLHQNIDADDRKVIQDIGYSEGARSNMQQFIQDFEEKQEAKKNK